MTTEVRIGKRCADGNQVSDDFMAEDAWYLGDLNVNLVMFSVSEDSEVSFNVVYQTRVSENAKNL